MFCTQAKFKMFYSHQLLVWDSGGDRSKIFYHKCWQSLIFFWANIKQLTFHDWKIIVQRRENNLKMNLSLTLVKTVRLHLSLTRGSQRARTRGAGQERVAWAGGHQGPGVQDGGARGLASPGHLPPVWGEEAHKLEIMIECYPAVSGTSSSTRCCEGWSRRCRTPRWGPAAVRTATPGSASPCCCTC